MSPESKELLRQVSRLMAEVRGLRQAVEKFTAVPTGEDPLLRDLDEKSQRVLELELENATLKGQSSPRGG